MAKLQWTKEAQIAQFAAEQTDAYRLCSGDDGWAERLGNDVLICFRHERGRRRILEGLAKQNWQPTRVFEKALVRREEDRSSPTLIRGAQSLSKETVVQEAGVRYALDFAAGYSHGLFLDQRANRELLRRAAPKRLLNTFSYSCSFSVVAALGGAETVSVDLSKKSLDRGRENFLLNGLEPSDQFRFIADDVLEVLPRLIRRGEKFDTIILDPPTFSRGNKGKLWQVEEHLSSLLLETLLLVTPQARILLSTNCTNIDRPTLQYMIRDCLRKAELTGKMHREPALPDFPSGHGANTVWVTLG